MVTNEKEAVDAIIAAEQVQVPLDQAELHTLLVLVAKEELRAGLAGQQGRVNLLVSIGDKLGLALETA